jgi:bifunctional non-homologous end joining protein LigD
VAATVSITLKWDELEKGLKMADFTIFNTMEHVEILGDIF